MYNQFINVLRDCLNEIKLARDEIRQSRDEVRSVQRAIANFRSDSSNSPESELWKSLFKGSYEK